MKKKLFITAFTLLITFSSSVYSQELAEWPRKYSNVSIFASSMGFVTVVNGSLDFMLFDSRTHHGATTGLTITNYTGEGGDLGIHLAYTFMTGKRNSHFEFKLGGVLNIIPLSDNYLSSKAIPVITLGYRFQRPDGKTFFRTALSTAGIGIGVGSRIKY